MRIFRCKSRQSSAFCHSQEKVELLFRASFSMSTAPGRVLNAVDVLENG